MKGSMVSAEMVNLDMFEEYYITCHVMSNLGLDETIRGELKSAQYVIK